MNLTLGIPVATIELARRPVLLARERPLVPMTLAYCLGVFNDNFYKQACMLEVGQLRPGGRWAGRGSRGRKSISMLIDFWMRWTPSSATE